MDLRLFLRVLNPIISEVYFRVLNTRRNIYFHATNISLKTIPNRIMFVSLRYRFKSVHY